MYSFFKYLITVAATASLATSAVVQYDWTISWLMANVDGRLMRPVISVNGEWPGPTVRANLGDTIQITARNNLGNETMSLHWHGMHQSGSNEMDGPVGVTQCGINPGQAFTYEFTVQQTGTYWWHSHAAGQYTDGLRGPLIIEDPNPPFHWDEEQVLTLSDWYHEQMPILLPKYLSPGKNPDGSEPIPYTALVNEAPTTSFQMQPGKTYYFRVINMAAFSQIYLNLEDHEMTIIEVDGVYTEPRKVKSIYVATAQRYGVLVTAKKEATRNYAFLASLDTSAFDHTTKYLQNNATGQLIYKAGSPPANAITVDRWDTTDDFTLVPFDRMPLLSGTPDQRIVMDLNFSTIAGQNRATWNNITYISPKVPSIATALTAGKWASDARIYGTNSNAHVIQKYNGLVEIVINNYDDGQHPIHIHGHQVQIVSKRSNIFGSGDPEKRSTSLSTPSMSTRWRSASPEARSASKVSMRAIPIRRDTWTLAPLGQTIIRYKADNPGIWLFHCHMEWHVEAGLAALMVEVPEMMQQSQTMAGVDQLCGPQNISVAGNAVGNTQDWFDLTGEVTVPPINHGALINGTTPDDEG